jgi:hypothetical protein
LGQDIWGGFFGLKKFDIFRKSSKRQKVFLFFCPVLEDDFKNSPQTQTLAQNHGNLFLSRFKSLKKLSLFYIEDLRRRNLIWEVQIG